MVKYSTLDRTFSALSDPTRREILERLARGPATISELAVPFEITLPGLMKHVRILEDAQLVITEKQDAPASAGSGPSTWTTRPSGSRATGTGGRAGSTGSRATWTRREEERTAVSHDLKLERLFDAAPAVVFDAFTDPDAQKGLYADAPDWIVEAECDLRAGGRWSVAFGPPGSTPARETNLFQVVDRPRRLVYSSTMTMPDGSSLDTDMQVTFEEDNGGIRMTIVQRGFPTAQARDGFADGWPSILDGLGRVVAASAARVMGRS
jgi:uncharacterized protein YndB with AHSA1/START domain